MGSATFIREISCGMLGGFSTKGSNVLISARYPSVCTSGRNTCVTAAVSFASFALCVRVCTCAEVKQLSRTTREPDSLFLDGLSDTKKLGVNQNFFMHNLMVWW